MLREENNLNPHVGNELKLRIMFFRVIIPMAQTMEMLDMHLLTFTLEELLWWSPNLRAPFLHLKALPYTSWNVSRLSSGACTPSVSFGWSYWTALAVSSPAQVLNKAYHCNSLICTPSRKCFEIQLCKPLTVNTADCSITDHNWQFRMKTKLQKES